jgi:ribosome-associated heat shock protein Hsp15
MYTNPLHERVSVHLGAGARGWGAKIANVDTTTTRVDRWLWAIRLFKTRTDATDACRGGHVKVNGATAKPATPVRIGDRVAAHLHERDRLVEVTRLIDKRVGPPIAVECYVDHSPPAPPREAIRPLFRDPGAGRPTKRERRQMDRFRSR